MASLPKALATNPYFRCPNPDCRSKNTFFSSCENLTKHLGQKPECRSFVAKAALAKMDATTVSALINHGIGQCNTNNQLPNATGTMAVTTIDDEEDNTSEGNFPTADPEEDMDDYEGFGFVNHDADQLDLPGYQTTYTTRREVEIRLLKLCTEMEAPLYAFEEIMKWARHAYDLKYDFQPKQSTYRDQVKKLELWMGMENHRPTEIPVSLPSDKRDEDLVNVTVFDFRTQLQSLLDDPVLNRDENLVINAEDRFSRYVPPNGRLGECLSGSWYNHAWDEMEKDGICNFMIPIIFYIDKTQVSTSGKLSIHPVQMSLGIFTEKVSTHSPSDITKF
jgi:Plavaka transposase